MNPEHFRRYVIRPTLKQIGMYSQEAEDLLLGTAMAESRLTWLAQKGNGPALGVYQIEPPTLDDVWRRYAAGRPDIRRRVEPLIADSPNLDEQLQTNLAFATAIARLKYWMDPAPLPSPHDYDHSSYVFALGEVWKRQYNTSEGDGTVEHFVSNYTPAMEGR
jgi:hypothetical protein